MYYLSRYYPMTVCNYIHTEPFIYLHMIVSLGLLVPFFYTIVYVFFCCWRVVMHTNHNMYKIDAIVNRIFPIQFFVTLPLVLVHKKIPSIFYEGIVYMM